MSNGLLASSEASWRHKAQADSNQRLKAQLRAEEEAKRAAEAGPDVSEERRKEVEEAFLGAWATKHKKQSGHHRPKRQQPRTTKRRTKEARRKKAKYDTEKNRAKKARRRSRKTAKIKKETKASKRRKQYRAVSEEGRRIRLEMSGNRGTRKTHRGSARGAPFLPLAPLFFFQSTWAHMSGSHNLLYAFFFREAFLRTQQTRQ